MTAIELPGGGRVEDVVPGMNDRHMVTLVDPDGERHPVRWGTVIAMTNGAVLDADFDSPSPRP